MDAIGKAGRITDSGRTVRYVIFHDDFPVTKLTNTWTDTTGETKKSYVVQTHTKVAERCILMASDPGDLILDPTCGSGTAAYVSQNNGGVVGLRLIRPVLPWHWRVLALWGLSYPVLSTIRQLKKVQIKEAEVQFAPILREAHDAWQSFGKVFIYERSPHITLGAIAHNAQKSMSSGSSSRRNARTAS